MMAFSPGARKMIAVGILAGIFLALFATISPLVIAYKSNSLKIRNLYQQRQKLNSIVAFEPRLKTFASRAEKNIKQNWFLQPGKASLAKANLRTRLKILATSVGAQIESMRSLPDKPQSGLTYVGLRIKMSGSYQAIYQSLQIYETSLPFLFIDNLRLSGDRIRQRAATPQSVLTVEYNIFGALQITPKPFRNRSETQ